MNELNQQTKLESPKTLELMGLKKISKNSLYYNIFMNFPYDDWIPARQRYEFVNKYAKGKSLLDIGCGYYPISAEVKMPMKVGIDVSIKAARKSVKEFNQFYLLDISSIDKEILKKYLGNFDTIVASEILEHLEEPYSVIEKISYLLKKNGRILITVPNGNSIANKVDKLRNKGKSERFKIYHKSHVSLLSASEWIRLFDKADLEVEIFDIRPSDIVEGFPNEKTFMWKNICSINPELMAHQFFFVLKKKGERK